MADEQNPINTNPIEYEQGMRARLSSINPSDAPYDADSAPGKAWKAGYDAGEPAAARDKTSGPVDQQDSHDDDGKPTDDKPKASAAKGQTDTLADLNKKS